MIAKQRPSATVTQESRAKHTRTITREKRQDTIVMPRDTEKKRPNVLWRGSSTACVFVTLTFRLTNSMCSHADYLNAYSQHESERQSDRPPACFRSGMDAWT